MFTADLTQVHQNTIAGGCITAYPTVHLRKYLMSNNNLLLGFYPKKQYIDNAKMGWGFFVLLQ